MKAEIGVYPKDRQILHEIVPLDTPLGVDIHITHYCNFRCNYCIFSQTDEELEKSGLTRCALSWEMFQKIVEQLTEFPHKVKMITLTGGEPTTHPHIVDMVKALHDTDVAEKIQIITNGSRLSPELGEKLVEAGLGELRISLQGLTAEKYFEISKVKINWDKFYENICYFSKIRGNCDLKVKVADIALDITEDEKFYSLFGDICDAVAIEHIYDAWEHNGYILDIEKRETQKTRYGLNHQEIAICRAPFTRLDILPDGMVTQFCHIRFGHEKNILESPLAEQWNSAGQNELRIAMLKAGRKQFQSCVMCKTCESTWHPEDILDGHEEEILTRMNGKI